MSNIFSFRSFREFLRNCFEIRQQKNAAYSLRQFAKDIGVSHNRLSEILSSDSAISLSLAAKMAGGLKLKTNERDFFLDLVRAECARTLGAKNDAALRLKEHFGGRAFKVENEQDGGLLSKWYYLGLVELLTKMPPAPDDEIKRILGIDSNELTEAKAFLLGQKVIAANAAGGNKKNSPYLKFESAVPSRLIRNFHFNVLKKAQTAIEEQKISDRKYLSSFVGLRKETLEEARKELEIFNQKFLKKFASEKAADSVYCFSMQLFRFDQEKT